MKKLIFFGALSLMSTTGAFAQTSLEISGGPTSTISQNEIKSIRDFPTDLKKNINRLLEKAKTERDPSKVKEMLKEGMMNIKDSAGDKMNNTLLKQSVIAGLDLNRLIQAYTINLGPARTPQGIVRQQVRILKHSLEMASRYYQKDQDFYNGLINNSVRQTQWAYFGQELSNFIIKMSDGVLNAPAAYGMIRWSLGVLEKNLLNDPNRPAFHDAIVHLDGDLAKMPNLMAGETAPSDIECIANIRKLKFTAKETNEELKVEFNDMTQN